MRVLDDGIEDFVGILAPGEAITIDGEVQVEITASNAAALLITHNGNPHQDFGKRGQPIHITFTDEMQIAPIAYLLSIKVNFICSITSMEETS